MVGGNVFPKFCPLNFLWIVSQHREFVGSKGYSLLIATTISVNTMAKVLDGNIRKCNVPTAILVRIVFPVLLYGPKPV
jgi:hypothetical protein